MVRSRGGRFQLREDEYWCRLCEMTVYSGNGLYGVDGEPLKPGEAADYGGDICCGQCGEYVHNWVPVKDKNKALFMRWMYDCRQKNLIGPSPGGAAGELKVSRARIYSLVAEGVLVRTDCEIEGYQSTFISQRSINARKKQVEAMRAAGKNPGAGGKPWHKDEG